MDFSLYGRLATVPKGTGVDLVDPLTAGYSQAFKVSPLLKRNGEEKGNLYLCLRLKLRCLFRSAVVRKFLLKTKVKQELTHYD